ncbi:MAG: peptide deformylase [Myxococcota bacterium]|nr:peptide deformylase [Myxococcota bacterium]
MIQEVLQFPDPRLREKAEPIRKEAVDAELRQLAADMASTMYAEPGIGLAATQVGVARRLVVIDTDWAREDSERNLRVLINPEIVEREGRAVSEEEACLSVPDFNADVDRDARVVVRARSLDWDEIVIEATGLEAFCLQHEIDHLDGVLFIDRISRLKRDLYARRRKRQLRRQRESAGSAVSAGE